MAWLRSPSLATKSIFQARVSSLLRCRRPTVAGGSGCLASDGGRDLSEQRIGGAHQEDAQKRGDRQRHPTK